VRKEMTPRKRETAESTTRARRATTTSRTRRATTTSTETPVEDGLWQSGIIDTPRGPYTPTSDILTDELIKAARFAGLTKFKVFVNGKQIKKEADLPCAKISDLPDVARVEGVEGSIAIRQYDKAGR